MGRVSTWCARLAACALLTSVAAGCSVGGGSRDRAPRTWQSGGYQTGGHQPHAAERFRPLRPRRVESAHLALPGSRAARLVRYEVVDGVAVLEGDIVLGPAHSVAQRFATPRPMPGPTPATGGLPGWGFPLPGLPLGGTDGAMPVRDESRVWPRGEIPYEIDGSVSADKRTEIDWAIGELATAGIKVRPRTAADVDAVLFRDVGEGCNSHLGRTGGVQPINLSNCAPRVTLHELMHAVGFQHEHARSDRDQYVTIHWDEIADDMRHAFEKGDDWARDTGPYDYGSILHYPTHAFSKRGNPTVTPLAAGQEIGMHRGLSALDKAGIQQLYGQGGAPTAPPATPSAPAPAAAPWGGIPGWPQGIPGQPIPWLAPAAPPGQPTAPGQPGQPAQQPGILPGLPPLPQGWPQGF